MIVEARRHRIRLILSLVNNLNAFGGKAQYVRWAQEAGINVSSSTDLFFSHPTIKDHYKAYIRVCFRSAYLVIFFSLELDVENHDVPILCPYQFSMRC